MIYMLVIYGQPFSVDILLAAPLAWIPPILRDTGG